MKDDIGSKIVAVILGFGLAAMFRRVCRGDNCMIVKGPGPDAISQYYYKIEDDCYKYKPYAVNCDKAAKTATDAKRRSLTGEGEDVGSSKGAATTSS